MCTSDFLKSELGRDNTKGKVTRTCYCLRICKLFDVCEIYPSTVINIEDIIEGKENCMGCNSRTSYWDFSITKQESLLNFTPIVCFDSQTTEDDCVSDLKLGSLGELNTFLENNSLTSLMDSSSSPGSHKRVRANKDTGQVPSCLVDECVADLSKCREYHRRHRVCEAHSKTPIVTIGCQEQRFCQQCSRFHSLGEFDESKRSCRKRLDGHNRRRRKPQPHSLSLNSANYIPSHQGSTIISYGTQYFRDAAVATSSWNEAAKAQNSNLYTLNLQQNCKTDNFPSSFSQGYSGEKQFPFMQSAAHLSQPHLNNSSTALGNAASFSNHKLQLSDGFNRVTTSSDCASSLLSSSHAGTLVFNPTHFVQRPTQPSITPSAHYNSLAMESAAAMDSLSLAADRNINGNMDCPEIVPNDSNDCHQTITFSWG